MPHQTALLATIAAAFALAFLLGALAARLRLPPLVGYLLAGVALGPVTPGWVADAALPGQLAEIGVILLMFGVGLHFSPRDLLAVRRVVVPGALVQMGVAAALGTALARAWGWPWEGALVLGLSLSVASTVVVLRTLEARGRLDTADGRTAIAWLVAQDLAMVLVLVLLPALAPAGGARAGGTGLWAGVALTLAKVGAFLALMLVGGRRAVPWLLVRVARLGSRELFTLAVLTIALGVAVGASALFGVSFALGAFFAGVVISESELSHQAGADALPLQDAFAVLFFVSVGMLFDPLILGREPLRVLAVVGVVLAGNALAALVLLVRLGHPARASLIVAASLGQIGEFSFILAGLGVALGLLPPEGRSLVLAAALVSIAGNPLLLAAAAAAERWLALRPHVLDRVERAPRGVAASHEDATSALHDHAVLVGHGRVGRTIGEALAREGLPFVVVERDHRTVEALRDRGVPAVYGDASRAGVLAHAHPERARVVVVATPDPYQARHIVELARRARPGIDAVVRTHSTEAQEYFERIGVAHALMGEHQLAIGMARYTLAALGCDEQHAERTVRALERHGRQEVEA